MPVNIPGTNTWEANIQAPADGDAVENSIAALGHEDAANRTVYLWNRLMPIVSTQSSVGPNDPAILPFATGTAEVVAASGYSTAASLYINLGGPFAAGDIIQIRGVVRCWHAAGAAAFKVVNLSGLGQVPGAIYTTPTAASPTSICVDYVLPAPTPFIFGVQNLDAAAAMSVGDIWNVTINRLEQ